MKNFVCLLVVITFLVFPQTVTAGSGWLVFYEESFKGKVIDEETKQPLEGAVVVAVYQVYKFSPIEGGAVLSDVREILTNQNGEFSFPSVTGFIVPWSVGWDTHFLLWKPGYREKYITESYLFTKEPGTIQERAVQTDKGFEMKAVRFGIIELHPAKTMDERRRFLPMPMGNQCHWKGQKKLIEMIRQEWESITGRPAEDLYKF